MAYIRKLPSGRWQATVRLPNGRKATRTDPLRKIVADWATQQEAAISRGQWHDQRQARLTFGDWLDRWMAALVGEHETRRAAESAVRNHVRPKWEHWQIGAIARLDVQSWVRQLELDGVGPSAIRSAFNTFAKAMSDAALEGIIPATPCRKIKLPATPLKPPRWYTREQADLLLAEMREPHRTMTALMLWCGLRWGEAAGLRGDAVDWLRGRLIVRATVSQHGKPKPYPKTSTSIREVPVPRHVLEAMSTLLDGRDRSDFVFLSRTSRAFDAASWRKSWYLAIGRANARAAKLSRRPAPPAVPAFSPHTCRHTAASWLVQAGVPLYEVKQLMGHASMATTMRYAHLAPGSHAAVEDAWARAGASAAHGATSKLSR